VFLKSLTFVAFAVLLTAAAAQTPPAKAPAPDPKQERTLFLTGGARLQEKKFEDATAAFGKLRQLGDVAGTFGIAQVLMAQGKADEAIRFLANEAANNPARAEFPVAIGDLEMRAGRNDQALEQFQKALTLIDFKSAEGFYVHRSRFGVNPLEDSLAALAGPDGTPRGAAGIYARISEIYNQNKDAASAIAALRKARELQPHDAVVLGTLGAALEGGGKRDEAIALYREALVVQPNDAMALNNLAFALADSGGDLFEALRYARRAQYTQPDSPEIADTIAWISLKQGWIDDALAAFVGLVRKQPGNPIFRNHLVAALDRLEKPAPSILELKTALKAAPSDENNQKILKLMSPPQKPAQ